MKFFFLHRGRRGRGFLETKSFSFFLTHSLTHSLSFLPLDTNKKLSGDCALRAWVLVTHVDPLRAYLFDGGIFESNTKHLTYWQAANEGVLGKVGEKTGDDKSKEQHTALGADNEKPTPWALTRLRKFIGDATGKVFFSSFLVFFSFGVEER